MAGFFGENYGNDDWSWVTDYEYTSPATLWRPAESVRIPAYQSGRLPPLDMPPLGNPFVFQNPWPYLEHSGPPLDIYNSRFGGGLFGYDDPPTFGFETYEIPHFQFGPKMKDIKPRMDYPEKDLPTGMGNHGPISRNLLEILMQLISG